MHNFSGGEQALAFWERQRARRRPLPSEKVFPHLSERAPELAPPSEGTLIPCHERIYAQRWPVERLRCLGKVVNLLIHLGPPLSPVVEYPAVLGDGAVELCIFVCRPLGLLHQLGRIQLVGVELLAETELSGDQLVHSEDHKLDIVAVLLVFEFEAVVLIPFPSELGCAIEIEQLDDVGLGVDEKVPGANITVNDAEAEVKVVDNLLTTINQPLHRKKGRI